MGQNEFPLLPEIRQQIHDLTLQKHASGLSPPEQEILSKLEGKENYLPEQSDDCPGYCIFTLRKSKRHL